MKLIQVLIGLFLLIGPIYFISWAGENQICHARFWCSPTIIIGMFLCWVTGIAFLANVGEGD